MLRTARITVSALLTLIVLTTGVLWIGSAIAFMFNGVPNGWTRNDYLRTAAYLLAGTTPIAVGAIRYSQSDGTVLNRFNVSVRAAAWVCWPLLVLFFAF